MVKGFLWVSFLILPWVVLAQKNTLQTYYYTGELKESEGKADKEGKKNGLWKFWNAEGDLVMTAEYKNGLLHGEKLVEETRRNTGLTMSSNPKLYERALKRQKVSELDTIIEKMQYKEDKLHGLKSIYEADGTRITEIEFKEGKKHGQERHYNPMGGVITERHFYYEDQTDSAYFYSHGELELKNYIVGNRQIQLQYIHEKLLTKSEREYIEAKEATRTIICWWKENKYTSCDTTWEYPVIADEDNYVIPDEPIVASNSEEIFEITEVMPEFPGGIEEMYAFITRSMSIDTAKVHTPVTGRIFAGFVVMKDGSITDPTILRGLDPELDRAVLDIIARMPKWTPGIQNGKYVNVRFRIPVKITLE